MYSINEDARVFYLSALPTSLVFRIFLYLQDKAGANISSNWELNKDKELFPFGSPLHFYTSLLLALALAIFFIMLSHHYL